MSTAEDLIEFLKKLPPKTQVRFTDGTEIVHMSSGSGDIAFIGEKPIAYCNRTGGYVYPTSVEGYFGVSAELDEDVEEWETSPLEPEWPKLGE